MENSSQELEQVAQVVQMHHNDLIVLLRDLDLSLVGGGTGDISLG
jgi:hypothetical protein